MENGCRLDKCMFREMWKMMRQENVWKLGETKGVNEGVKMRRNEVGKVWKKVWKWEGRRCEKLWGRRKCENEKLKVWKRGEMRWERRPNEDERRKMWKILRRKEMWKWGEVKGVKEGVEMRGRNEVRKVSKWGWKKNDVKNYERRKSENEVWKLWRKVWKWGVEMRCERRENEKGGVKNNK